MKWIVVISAIFILSPISGAQVPDTLWTRTFGGLFNDFGHSVDLANDDGYVVAGESYSLDDGSYDIFLLKLNTSGDTLWSRFYGGIQSEYGNSVIPTSDSGYALIGETRSYGAGSYDIYIIKTDRNGDTLWTRTFGSNDYEKGKSIFQTSDGGYIFTGSSRSSGLGEEDVFLIKTDSAGIGDWLRVFGGADHDCGNSVAQTSDGGYIIAGETESFGIGSLEGYVVRTDMYADTLWTRTFGGSGDDALTCIRSAAEGGYILAGYTSSFGAGMADGWLIKMDDSGDTLWTRTFGGAGNDYIYSVWQTSDGGYMLGGSTESFGAVNGDVYVIKTDSTGDMLWYWNYGGPGEDGAASIRQTADEGFIVAGSTTSFGAGGNDALIIRLTSDQTSIAENGNPYLPAELSLNPNYPNPFNAVTTISFQLAIPGNVKLAVYDLLGREIAILVNGYLETGNYTIDFDASGLSSGVYFYRMWAGDAVETRRMVLLK